jgi:hypothetical protein
MIDTLKGAALIATFIGVLIIFAMWVSLWENVWQASVEPTRGAIYDARLKDLRPAFAQNSWATRRRQRWMLSFSSRLEANRRHLVTSGHHANAHIF